MSSSVAMEEVQLMDSSGKKKERERIRLTCRPRMSATGREGERAHRPGN